MQPRKLVVIAFNLFCLIYSPLALICEFSRYLPSIVLDRSNGVVGPNPVFYVGIVLAETVVVCLHPTILLYPDADDPNDPLLPYSRTCCSP